MSGGGSSLGSMVRQLLQPGDPNALGACKCWLQSIPATHFTVMPPPPAKLCRHLLQSYAATRLGSQNIIRDEGVFRDKRRFSQFLKSPYFDRYGVDGC